MDSTHRKQLKQDKFVEEVEHSVDFLTQHKKAATQYGAIALAVLVVAGGFYYFRTQQAATRATALADAMHVSNAVISANAAPPNLNFATQDLKDAAVSAAYQKVADQYSGTQEGAIAQLSLAGMKVDKNDLDGATKLYQTVADTAPANYASLAKLSLSDIYSAQGKSADAEKILRSLIDSPTAFVSKDQASLSLGRLLATSNPVEARKILEPLREARTAVSRAAIAALGNIPASAAPATPVKN
jgi:predicted negative regulator of RcsB-dependent stress response